MPRDRLYGDIPAVETVDRFVVLVMLCFPGPCKPPRIVADSVERI